MRKLLYAATAVLCLNQSAMAADLLIKAPSAVPVPVAAPSNSGFYVGLGFLGTVTNQQLATAGGIFSSILNGAESIGGDIGYQYWTSAGVFFALEVDADYDLRGATDVGAVKLGVATTNTTYRFMELAKVGMGLGGLLGIPASAVAAGGQAPQPIPVPSGFTTANAAPYIQFGAAEKFTQVCMVGCIKDTAKGWAVGGGVDLLIAQHINLDISYVFVDYTGGNTLAAPALMLKTPNEQLGKVSLNYKF
jgi:opacity protein-like surface antigen